MSNILQITAYANKILELNENQIEMCSSIYKNRNNLNDDKTEIEIINSGIIDIRDTFTSKENMMTKIVSNLDVILNISINLFKSDIYCEISITNYKDSLIDKSYISFLTERETKRFCYSDTIAVEFINFKNKEQIIIKGLNKFQINENYLTKILKIVN